MYKYTNPQLMSKLNLLSAELLDEWKKSEISKIKSIQSKIEGFNQEVQNINDIKANIVSGMASNEEKDKYIIENYFPVYDKLEAFSKELLADYPEIGRWFVSNHNTSLFYGKANATWEAKNYLKNLNSFFNFEKDIEKIEGTEKLPRPLTDNDKSVSYKDIGEFEENILFEDDIQEKDIVALSNDMNEMIKLLDIIKSGYVVLENGKTHDYSERVAENGFNKLVLALNKLREKQSENQKEQLAGNDFESLFNSGSEKGKNLANDKQKLDD